jgi:hypothetical protein
MTLHAQTEFTIPEETARVARAAYPHGNTLDARYAMRLGPSTRIRRSPHSFLTMAGQLRPRGDWL